MTASRLKTAENTKQPHSFFSRQLIPLHSHICDLPRYRKVTTFPISVASGAAESDSDEGNIEPQLRHRGVEGWRISRSRRWALHRQRPSTQASRSPAGMRLGSSCCGRYAAHHGQHRMGGAIVRSFGRAWIVVVLSRNPRLPFDCRSGPRELRWL
jgi:hypothetical protein